MPYFEYNQTVKNVEYYEILENLMERWEYEIVEFKEAKSSYDTDKIGRYFFRNQQRSKSAPTTIWLACFWRR